jgi:putrescine aminotransferase
MIAAELLKEHKVLVIFTLNNPNVIRLEPPLNVEAEELDYVVDALDKLFSRHKSFLRIALKSGKNVISSIFKK